MTWRMRVRHRTGYSYDGEVVSSFNEARMTPLSDSTQTTLESRVEISPPASVFRYRDYWGTQVTAFDIHSPHSELVVTSTSVVETALRPRALSSLASLGWGELGTDQVRDQFAEWLAFTPRTDPDGELSALARESAGTSAPADAAIACNEAIRAAMEYRLGATGVHTSGLQAWQERKGVCQDFAHVTLAMLRSLGVPCRYVSGYLHPKSSAEIGETVAGESHAWVEWWDGEWVGYDPTNGREVADQHVAVARGRDYDDVAPLKGIYSGPKSSGLGVVVEVTRLA
ncbi:transglutaminase family protein [Jatrophihabitans telluris]|uniref:Transglutaminase family protein n=1 Tax=Jatrophihabitans telluris TaxID=2038343 RepID=A0ABY4R1S4_9ACTN|nr:transglutaminase family protein [Jatrophihabitans telluris]UQX89226.1 transglutaminase family protein [Jatrophihabitans telluris]